MAFDNPRVCAASTEPQHVSLKKVAGRQAAALPMAAIKGVEVSGRSLPGIGVRQDGFNVFEQLVESS